MLILVLVSAPLTAQGLVPVTRHMTLVRASFYADGFDGRRMANGKTFRQGKITAASLTYPLGTFVTVTSLKTGRSINVEITDRGPWHTRFKLDLSKAAFRALGHETRAGWVWVTVVAPPD